MLPVIPPIGFANPTIATTVAGIDTGTPTGTTTIQSPSPTINTNAGVAPTKAAGSGQQVYIETSSDSSLVNQWAVISPNSGSRVTFSPDQSQAAGWSVVQDSNYTDVSDSDGSAFVDIATGYYAFIDGIAFTSQDPVSFPVVFREHAVEIAQAAYTPIVPQVSSLIQSVQMVKLATNFFGNLIERRADVLQVCNDGGSRYLTLGDYYDAGCANVTLKYV